MLYHHLRRMVSAVVVVLWVYVQIDNRAFGMENGDGCPPGLVMHTDKAGQNRCCENVECSPGTEAHFCDDAVRASCSRCKPGTFQQYQTESYLMMQCQKHTTCHYDAVVILAGSATSDVKCECDLGSGFYGDSPECRIHGGCGPGQQPTLSGGCEPCPRNSYLNRSSSWLCSPCSTCDSEMQDIYSNCSADSNTICRNKTLDHNGDKVNNSLWPIILGVIITVTVLGVSALVPIIICLRKRRNEDNSRSSVSFSSSENTSTNSEQDPANEQLCKGNRLPQQVKENHQRWVGDIQQEAVSLISDDHLQRSSLCESSAKPDIGHHKRNASEEWSPSADLSSMGTPVSTHVNLVDERENMRDREDDQPPIEYVVVNADDTTDSLPSISHGATVLRGNNNVQNGNIYHFENCQVKINN